MSKYDYRGFDKLEEDSVLLRALPLCDILHPFFGERDFSYIGAAAFPLEFIELILHFLKYEKNIDSSAIDNFTKKYFTEDSLCRIDKLLEIWGDEKFDQMIADLQILSEN